MEDGECTMCSTRPKGGRPPKSRKGVGRAKTIKGISDIMLWGGKTPLGPNVAKEMELAVGHYLKVKMQNSPLPGNVVQVETGGPQALTLAPVTIPRKTSSDAGKRAIQKRTKKVKQLVDLVSGGTPEAIVVQADLSVAKGNNHI